MMTTLWNLLWIDIDPEHVSVFTIIYYNIYVYLE